MLVAAVVTPAARMRRSAATSIAAVGMCLSVLMICCSILPRKCYGKDTGGRTSGFWTRLGEANCKARDMTSVVVNYENKVVHVSSKLLIFSEYRPPLSSKLAIHLGSLCSIASYGSLLGDWYVREP